MIARMIRINDWVLHAPYWFAMLVLSPPAIVVYGFAKGWWAL